MNKFWQWMKEKDYGRHDEQYSEYRIYNHPGQSMRVAVYPTPQMLIGYKLEYVRGHAFWNGVEDDMIDEQIAINNKLASFWSLPDIQAQLDSIIEEIDKEQ